MNLSQRYPCVMCLQENSLALKLDRNNRPYFICTEGCGCRIFPRAGSGARALAGPTYLFGPICLAAQAGEPPEVAQVLLKRAIEKAKEHADQSSNFGT